MNIQIYNPETNTIDFDLVLQIPEFQKLKETPQHSWWHEEGDAWEHTKLVVNKMIDFIDKNQDYQFFNDPQYREILVYSALFHDIGKPLTTFLGEDGYYHCPEHAVEGAKLTETLINNLSLDENIKPAIISLVRNHMRPIYVMKSDNPKQELLKLVNSLNGVDFRALILLKWCDDQGSIHPDSGYENLLKNAYDLFLEEISYPKGTYVKITKLETLNAEHKLLGHSNGIEKGDVYLGKIFTPITVGWGVFLGRVFHTSNVTEIVDKNHFKTLNSLYEITKYE